MTRGVKRLYPFNDVLPIMVNAYEKEALTLEAAERGITRGELARETLNHGGMRNLVQKFFPDHASQMADEESTIRGTN